MVMMIFLTYPIIDQFLAYVTHTDRYIQYTCLTALVAKSARLTGFDSPVKRC